MNRTATTAKPYKDRILLYLTAFLICFTGVGAFWLADLHHVNPVWVFFLGNSILLVPLFVRDFRSHLRKPAFVAFLATWTLVHGLLVATLMRWLSMLRIVPFMLVELSVGLFLADYLFDARPSRERK